MADSMYNGMGGARRVRDMGDGTFADITALPGVMPALVTANTAFDARQFGDVEFQFTAGTVSVTRSLDGTNYVAWPVSDSSGAASASAGTPGIWATDGAAWLKFSADVTVRGGA